MSTTISTSTRQAIATLGDKAAAWDIITDQGTTQGFLLGSAKFAAIRLQTLADQGIACYALARREDIAIFLPKGRN